MATAAQLELRRRGILPTNTPQAPQQSPWAPPAYTGSDPAYAAWLANANLRSTNATSNAKTRRAQAEESYFQAILDLDTQSVTGRRQLQGNMLGRGIFRSGETDRRKTEFDSAIEQGRSRAAAAQQDQFGQIDAQQRDAFANLGMEGAQQVSQAMLRDQLAAYNAQQAATAAPQAQYAAPAATPASTYTPTLPAQPKFNPVKTSAQLYAAQSKPKPKAASGSTGSLKLGSKKLQ